MQYTTFGRNTGLRVSELALGTPHDQIVGSLPHAQGGESARITNLRPPRA